MTQEQAYQTARRMRAAVGGGMSYHDWLEAFNKPDELQWQNVYESFKKWG